MNVEPTCEIRHLPHEVFQELSRMLNIHDFWQLVAEKITVSQEDRTPLYSTQHVYIMKNNVRDGPTITLLNDWGTYGRKRPTITDLITTLTECELYRVADYLAVDVLRGDPVQRNDDTFGPDDFPYANSKMESFLSPGDEQQEPIMQVSDLISDMNSTFNCNVNSMDSIGSDSTATNTDVYRKIESSVARVTYAFLSDITDKFNERKHENGGRKLGSGAFSDVYLGVQGEQQVAVKRLKKNFRREFLNEVNMLSLSRHKNIVKLLALSVSESNLCLVYEYLRNGSLQDRLAPEKPPLHWLKRVSIATDICRALVWVHNFGYVHRDVKSANVLLDEDLNAKLGDFGIAHIGPDPSVDSAIETSSICGTSVYMPKEAFLGIITPQMDTYSFGVVLLELLSGMKPQDPETKDDIVFLVKNRYSENNLITDIIDKEAGDWDLDCAYRFFQIAQRCLENYRKQRPTMQALLPELEQLVETMV